MSKNPNKKATKALKRKKEHKDKVKKFLLSLRSPIPDPNLPKPTIHTLNEIGIEKENPLND